MTVKTKKAAFLGLFIALALTFSFIESQIPPLITIPGVKLGLPNIVTVFLLYKFGWKETVTVNILRVFLVALLFGNIQSFLFSICGAVFSLLGMILLKKFSKFSCISVSVVGGVLHNMGQVLFAVFWTNTEEISLMLPLYILSGTVAGIVIGIISGLIVKKTEKFKI